jgi:two-component system, NarL family, sensor histidine kinase UhpB
MTHKNKVPNGNFEDLRKRAAQKIGDHNIDSDHVENMSIDELRHVIEELKIYRIELEMQNQELLETQNKLEKSRQKYSDLYDFAPVSYLTLNRDGKIMEANLTATKIIDIPRKSLIGTLLYSYIANEDRDSLYLHLREIFKSHRKHTCEIRLVGNPPLYLRLDSIHDTGDKEICRIIMTDITEQKKMEIELSQSERQLKVLSSKLMETQEKERKRIAYDLHDGIAQMLVASNFYTQNLAGRFSDNSNEYEILMKCIDINQKALIDLKRIVSDLRPAVLDSLGIIAAIEWLSSHFQTHDPLLTIIKKINVRESQVSENLKPVIFRILQEIMSNIIKHSQAKQVEISLEKLDGNLELRVKDNGKGFELGDVLFRKDFQQGIGITSMTERARSHGGCLEILSSKTTGTTVIARWPRNRKCNDGLPPE